MKKQKVISYSNLPARTPVSTTILLFLMRSVWGIEGVLFGVLATLLGIWWVASLVRLWIQEQVNILEDK